MVRIESKPSHSWLNESFTAGISCNTDNCDHSTVLYAIKVITKDVSTETSVRE